MKKIFILGIIATFFLASCCEEKKVEEVIIENTTDTLLNSEHLTMATLWFQKSAEVQAIFYQNFNLAKLMLDETTKGKVFKKLKKSKPLAVITDIDETILDNSPYNANLIINGTSYNKENWAAWVNEKRAKALPGAVDFCNYAKDKGVEVFYVSNRSADQTDATIENMKNEGFPFADKEHMYLKTKTSDKTARRNKILENYDVVLLLGDNLRDFDEVFGGRGEDSGFTATAENKDKFGAKFIVFPNPMYGEWEKGFYNGDFSKSNDEKRKLRRGALNR
ncbi:MAG: 5'-nucleotidase, lipoprotein e(P4) family [Bacteroidales bacterium]|nr:5'-nucleotidase, lipoprotein e(P4) family [Bacteroidales bacterium]